VNAPGSAPCELLSWDTEFFRCRIARVCGDTLEQERAVQVDEWSRSNRIRCLYFLSRADDPATMRLAEQHGFGLVDIRVTLERVTMDSDASLRLDPSVGVTIRPVQPADLSALQAMARAVHEDTRFFSDSHFTRQRAEELYSTWITLESQGRAQAVLVAASTADQPLGYISCHLEAARQEGQIGLVGVSSEVRGKGIGKNLVMAAMDWYRLKGVRAVTVVTQGRNRAAQRLYQQCGFLSRDLQLWYHKWYPTSD
jgi:dTDP-4-amino-4,6-dideoxy-D-galactose acyltransferase